MQKVFKVIVSTSIFSLACSASAYASPVQGKVRVDGAPEAASAFVIGNDGSAIVDLMSGQVRSVLSGKNTNRVGVIDANAANGLPDFGTWDGSILQSLDSSQTNLIPQFDMDGDYIMKVAATDINGDGFVDTFWGESGKASYGANDSISFPESKGNLKDGKTGAIKTLEMKSVQGVVESDITGDGINDLILVQTGDEICDSSSYYYLGTLYKDVSCIGFHRLTVVTKDGIQNYPIGVYPGGDYRGLAIGPAVGDFNGDGLKDVIVAESSAHAGVELFLNRGGGRLERVTVAFIPRQIYGSDITFPIPFGSSISDRRDLEPEHIIAVRNPAIGRDELIMVVSNGSYSSEVLQVQISNDGAFKVVSLLTDLFEKDSKFVRNNGDYSIETLDHADINGDGVDEVMFVTRFRRSIITAGAFNNLIVLSRTGGEFIESKSKVYPLPFNSYVFDMKVLDPYALWGARVTSGSGFASTDSFGKFSLPSALTALSLQHPFFKLKGVNGNANSISLSVVVGSSMSSSSNNGAGSSNNGGGKLVPSMSSKTKQKLKALAKALRDVSTAVKKRSTITSLQATKLKELTKSCLKLKDLNSKAKRSLTALSTLLKRPAKIVKASSLLEHRKKVLATL